MYCPRCRRKLFYVEEFPGRLACKDGHLWDLDVHPLMLREVVLQLVPSEGGVDIDAALQRGVPVSVLRQAGFPNK